MTWSELERLVETAERDGRLRRSLRHCRSRSELVLAARRLQYRITLEDILGARLLHKRQSDEASTLTNWRRTEGHQLEA